MDIEISNEFYELLHSYEDTSHSYVVGDFYEALSALTRAKNELVAVMDVVHSLEHERVEYARAVSTEFKAEANIMAKALLPLITD